MSTNQASTNRAEAQGHVLKDQCDAATLNAIHHHQEERMRMLRDELQNLPPPDRSFSHHKSIFQQTPAHVIKTKTERNLWHQRLCHFSPLITAQAHKCCDGVPEFKDDALCPTLDQCTARIQVKLKKVSPEKDGFNPDNVQLPCQCLSTDFTFASLLSKNKNWQQDI